MFNAIRSLFQTRRTRRNSGRRIPHQGASELLEDRCLLATIAWDGGAGTTNWSDAANWFDQTNSLNDVAPATADDVVINLAGSPYTVNLNINIATGQPVEHLNSLTVDSPDVTFVASSKTLTVNGNSTLAGGVLNLNSSVVTGTGTFTNQSVLNFNNGSSFDSGVSLVNAGDMIVRSAASSSNIVTVNGPFTMSSTSTLLLQTQGGDRGTVRLNVTGGMSSAGTITLDTVGQFSNRSYFVELNVTGGSLVNTGTIEALQQEEFGGRFRRLNAELVNHGTINVDSAVTLEVNRPGANHINTGTINLNNAAMSVVGIAGFHNQSTGAINGRTLVLTGEGVGSGAAFTNDGLITLNAGGLSASGFATISNNGSIDLTGGNGSISSYGTLNNAGSIGIGSGRTISMSGGTFVNQPAATLGGEGTITFSSATFDITTGAYATGTLLTALNLNNSLVTGSSTFTNQSVLNFNNGSSFDSGVSLVNAGDMIVRSAASSSNIVTVNGPFTMSSTSTLLLQTQGGDRGTARLNVTGGMSSAGTITLDTVGQFSNRSYFVELNVTGGSLVNTGTIEALQQEEFGGRFRRLNAELVNHGTINVDSAVTLEVNRPGANHINTGTINLNNAAMSVVGIAGFHNQSTGAINGRTLVLTGEGVGSGAAFTNDGLITLNAGGLSASGFATISNNGSIDLTGGNGSISSYGTLNNAGSIGIGSGRTISMSGGTFVNQPAATLGGEGTITFSSATFDITTGAYATGTLLTALNLNNSLVTGSSTFTNQSVLNFNNGSSFDSGVSLVNAGDMIVRSAASSSNIVTVNGPFTMSSTSTLLLQTQGGDRGTARLNVTGGMSSAGTITLDTVGQFSNRSYFVELNVTGGSLVNTGTIEALQQEEFGGRFRRLNAELVNHGTINVDSAVTLEVNRPGANHINTGTINFNNAAMSVVGIQSFNNSGDILGPHSMILTGGSTTDTFTNTGTINLVGTLTLSSFTSVLGTGTAGRHLSVVGSGMKPGLSPGVFVVSGNYSQSSGGSLVIEIGGSTPGNGAGFHDQLDVAGTVAIATNVALSLESFGGFVPVGGEDFVIVNNGSTDPVVGTFSGLAEGATVSADFLGSGMSAVISYQGGTDGNDIVIHVIDTVPPAPPSVPDLDSTSDSGASDSDDLTRETVPIFSGIAEPGSVVHLFSDVAGPIGTITADSVTGAWSLTSAVVLVDGPHQITATATDAASNTSAPSGALTIIIDTTAPGAPGTPDLVAASDTGVSDTDDITADNTPTVTGGAEADASLEVFDGAASVGITSANSAGGWAFTSGTLADGIHSFTVRATDAAGNVGLLSSALVVTIDTVGPKANVEQAAGQADPTLVSPVNFDVLFDEAVVGFDGTDVLLSGTAGATTVVATGNGATFLIAVSGMPRGGTVIADVAAAVVADLAGNVNGSSTSVDNSVTYRDAIYDFSTATFQIAENDFAHVSNVVEVTRSGNTSLTTSVDVIVTGTTASPGSDFTTGPVTISFAAGETSQTVPIEILGDLTVELDETIALSFAGFSGTGTSGTNHGTASLTIINDDSSVVSISASDSVASEPGNDGQFLVTLDNPSDSPTDISYLVTGSAENGVDYQTLSGTTTIPAEQLAATIDLSVVDDLLLEGSENVTLTLAAVSSGHASIAVGSVDTDSIVIDDDESIAVEFMASVSVLVEAGAAHDVAVRLAGAPGVTLAPGVSVSATVADSGTGSAISGSDYVVFADQTVTFASGAAIGDVQLVSVGVLADNVVEPAEQINLQVSSVTGPAASAGSPDTHQISITDDDTLVVEFNQVTGTAAEDVGSNLPRFLISGEVQTGYSVDINVAVTGGTATGGGVDFTNPSTLVVGAGMYAAVAFDIPGLSIVNDAIVESAETIQLGGISGGAVIVGDADMDSITVDSTTFVITDDDTGASQEPPSVTGVQSDASFENKAMPGQIVTVTATFSDPNAGDSHTSLIDWGDGVITDGAVNDATGAVIGTHAYSTGGVFLVKVTVIDGAGQFDSETAVSVVTGVRLTPSGQLQIVGTNERDHVKVHGRRRRIKVSLKSAYAKWERFSFDRRDVKSILIHTCDGNDQIHISQNIHVPATIHAGDGDDLIVSGGGDDLIRGGNGDDHILGRRGNDIILGGDGQDKINGGRGRDILIGGRGKDRLIGGPGDDILIGGSTDHDRNNQALSAIRAEWTALRSFNSRVQHIRNGGGRNGSYVLNASTVHADGDVDRMVGGAGRDWLWAECIDDVFSNLFDRVDHDNT
jgi:large repetitive protein